MTCLPVGLSSLKLGTALQLPERSLLDVGWPRGRGGGFGQKASNLNIMVPSLVSLALVLENTQKLIRALPFPFILHCALNLKGFFLYLWAPPWPQAPPSQFLAAPDSWFLGREGLANTAELPVWTISDLPKCDAEAFSPKLAGGPEEAHMPSSVSGPQPVGCARSGLASAPSSLTPFPSIIPISSPGLAPARYLSTDLFPKNPCPALTVSTHPALFPSSPPTNHLPQGHWVHNTLCRALTQVESQPCPTWQPMEGSQQRQKPRATAQYLAGLSVFRTTHSP
uniref:Uncharacterized protein n=1 Tax=Mustela putorius furo TaxID=9669 RepID=M3Z558_MUSPF